MRDINRIELMLKDLKVLWLKNPYLRLGQLLHMVAVTGGWYDNDLFYLEDDKMASYIKKAIEIE